MAALKVPLLPLLVLPLLLSAALPAAAGFTTVSVNLTGPGEGWVTDDLQYNANPVCEVDAETAEKISNNEAFLTTALSYSYYPAAKIAGGGPSDPTITLSYANCSAGFYTIYVSYLCSITYQGGGADYASAQSSKQIKIKRLTMMAMAGGYSICAGAKENAAHKVTIVASVSDGVGSPVSGKAVGFSAAGYAFAHTAPALNPASADTNAYGNASTVLTSGDGVTNGSVEVTCEDLTTWVTVNFEKSTIYQAVLDPVTGQPLMSLIPDGESTARVSLFLGSSTGAPAGHEIEWKLRYWAPEHTPFVDPPDYEGTGDATHGSLNPTTATTDAMGAATTTYTCGTVLGHVQFFVTDKSVHVWQ